MTRHNLNLRAAAIAELIEALQRSQSWCGETHIQKAAYLLQALTRVDLGYEFVLYKHGPYSFDLATDIATMRAAKLIDFTFRAAGYGPSIQLTAFAPHVFKGTKRDLEPLLPAIAFIAEWLGPHDVRYLERVATAHFVRQQFPHEAPATLAEKLRKLKPHISEHDSLNAVRQIEEKIAAVG
jgi:hypothetical protein